MEDKKLLSGFTFFSDVAPEALKRIASISEILEFKPNQTVFHFEDPAEYFYGLIKGKVDLILIFMDKVLRTEIEYEEAVHAKMVDKEKQIVVDSVHPGQVFGWASIVGPARRTVTAMCAEQSRVFAVPAAELKAMCEADHSLGYLLMKRMSGIISSRLKNRTDKLVETWVEAFDLDAI